MQRTTHTLTVIGASSGDRGKMIQAFAHKGAEVQLRPLGSGRQTKGFGVWVRCIRFWGLWKTWAHIGYVASDGTDPWAPTQGVGSIRVVKAWVHSNFAPLETDPPKVCLRVVTEADVPEGLPAAAAR